MECQNQYTLHNFADSPLNIYGTQTQTQTAVHGRQITLISHHPMIPLPPAGIFDWQDVQCVLKKFGSQTYSDLGNIAFFAFPFRTQEDDDEDDSNGLGDEDDEQILLIQATIGTLLGRDSLSTWRQRSAITGL